MASFERIMDILCCFMDELMGLEESFCECEPLRPTLTLRGRSFRGAVNTPGPSSAYRYSCRIDGKFPSPSELTIRRLMSGLQAKRGVDQPQVGHDPSGSTADARDFCHSIRFFFIELSDEISGSYVI